jgi:hypothetical protein
VKRHIVSLGEPIARAVVKLCDEPEATVSLKRAFQIPDPE